MAPDELSEIWLKLWQDTPDLEFDRGNNANCLIPNFLALGIEKDAEILFPLCGKAKSMITIARHGYRIAGIEISPIAISRFFSEHGLNVTQETKDNNPVYVARELPIEIHCADIFKRLPLLCQGFFDVAALVAISPGERKRYVDALRSMLAPGAKGIVAVIQYDGPALTAPFPVSGKEFHALFSDRFKISEMDKYEAKVHPAHPLASRKLEGIIYAVESR